MVTPYCSSPSIATAAAASSIAISGPGPGREPVHQQQERQHASRQQDGDRVGVGHVPDGVPICSSGESPKTSIPITRPSCPAIMITAMPAM